MFARRLYLGAALLTTFACAGAPDPEAGAAPNASHQGDLITTAELNDPSLGSANLLEAVRRLRPRFLSSRGPSSIANPSAGVVHVSTDGGPLASAGVLANYLPNSVVEVRFLNANDAALRFGTAANGGGVILVKSR